MPRVFKRVHPAEVNMQLGIAHAGVGLLIQDAEERGDIAGADAWQVARASIEAAENAMRAARERQTWGKKEGR